MLLRIPNLPSPLAPVGTTEDDNVVLRPSATTSRITLAARFVPIGRPERSSASTIRSARHASADRCSRCCAATGRGCFGLLSTSHWTSIENATRRSFHRTWCARRRSRPQAICPSSRRTHTALGTTTYGSSQLGRYRSPVSMEARFLSNLIFRDATWPTRCASGARRHRLARTHAGCSGCTNSTRSSWSN